LFSARRFLFLLRATNCISTTLRLMNPSVVNSDNVTRTVGFGDECFIEICAQGYSNEEICAQGYSNEEISLRELFWSLQKLLP
jgi:hypothetical protein